MTNEHEIQILKAKLEAIESLAVDLAMLSLESSHVSDLNKKILGKKLEACHYAGMEIEQ